MIAHCPLVIALAAVAGAIAGATLFGWYTARHEARLYATYLAARAEQETRR